MRREVESWALFFKPAKPGIDPVQTAAIGGIVSSVGAWLKSS